MKISGGIVDGASGDVKQIWGSIDEGMRVNQAATPLHRSKARASTMKARTVESLDRPALAGGWSERGERGLFFSLWYCCPRGV